MYCAVCGDIRNIKYYERQRQYLCPYCRQDMPTKVGRTEFVLKTMGKWRLSKDHAEEFYSDYLHSEHTLKSYLNRRGF